MSYMEVNPEGVGLPVGSPQVPQSVALLPVPWPPGGRLASLIVVVVMKSSIEPSRKKLSKYRFLRFGNMCFFERYINVRYDIRPKLCTKGCVPEVVEPSTTLVRTTRRLSPNRT